MTGSPVSDCLPLRALGLTAMLLPAQQELEELPGPLAQVRVV
jgi:hypothetical protein